MMSSAGCSHVATTLLGLAQASADGWASVPCRAELVCPPGHPLPDSSGKYRLLNEAGEPVAFGFEATGVAPDAVARDARNANRARALLGGELGRCVLTPIAEAELEGRSLAVYPSCTPLPSRLPWLLQRGAVRDWCLDWLTAVAVKTLGTAAESRDSGRIFERPLEHLAQLDGVPAPARSDAKLALARLRDGRWTPRHVLMHGDFWRGNLMVRRAGSPRPWAPDLAVIDWGTSEVVGYAAFDLVRIAQSLRMRPARLRRELSRHVEVLGCDLVDARGYVLAALGHRALNLEFFPLDRFLSMAASCHATISEAT